MIVLCCHTTWKPLKTSLTTPVCVNYRNTSVSNITSRIKEPLITLPIISINEAACLSYFILPVQSGHMTTSPSQSKERVYSYVKDIISSLFRILQMAITE